MGLGAGLSPCENLAKYMHLQGILDRKAWLKLNCSIIL
jgi:hypothetical protein